MLRKPAAEPGDIESPWDISGNRLTIPPAKPGAFSVVTAVQFGNAPHSRTFE
jgi:hypothetical protein